MFRIVTGELGSPQDTRVFVYNKVGTKQGITVSHPLNQLHTPPRPETFTKKDMMDMIMPMRTYACQSNVSDDYIKTAFGKAQLVCILYNEHTAVEERHKRSGTETVSVRYIKPLGFILAYPQYSEDPKREMYIDIICSSAQGSMFLQHFTSYVQATGYKSIGLSSLPSVLAYYPKFGYEFRKDCESPVLVAPSDEIKQYLAAKNPAPKTSYDAYTVPAYLKFMVDLHNQGLSVKTDKECGKLPMDGETLKTYDCGVDGYTMKRCNIQPLSGGRRIRNQTCRKRPYAWNSRALAKSPFKTRKGVRTHGFSARSSLKSMGRIPRSNGCYVIGDKYKQFYA
jgi:hypothetical protein